MGNTYLTETAKAVALAKAYLVENGVTVNLPIAYDVEGGVTALLWKSGSNIGLMVFGRSATYLTSEDGVTWTENTVNTTYASTFGILDAAHGDGRVVAVGYDSYSGKWSCYSVDGVTLTLSAMPYQCRCICYGDGRFVAGADSGNVFYSIDGGVTWTKGVSGHSYTIIDICYEPKSKRFVMISGDSTGNYPRVYYSTDGGATWTVSGYTLSESSHNHQLGIACDDNYFYAVTRYNVQYTDVGLTKAWSKISGLYQSAYTYNDIKRIGDYVYALGIYGKIARIASPTSYTTMNVSGIGSSQVNAICEHEGTLYCASYNKNKLFKRNGSTWEEIGSITYPEAIVSGSE